VPRLACPTPRRAGPSSSEYPRFRVRSAQPVGSCTRNARGRRGAETRGRCVPWHKVVLDNVLVTYPWLSPEPVRRRDLLEEPSPVLPRLTALAVVVIGVAVLVGAVGSATLWRPDARVSAALPSGPDQPAVVTAPGVLVAVDNTVQVRLIGATADSPVTLA